MEFHKIEGGGYRVGIPVPFPMKYVYCYLFPKEDHYILIDAGFNYPKARDTWEEVFQYLSIDPKLIQEIYITHFHPDHSGLAGWMQEKTGARVYMHDLDCQMFQRVWGKGSQQAISVQSMIESHGVPLMLSKEIEEHMEKMKTNVLPLPEIEPLPQNPYFAGREWDIIHTPGHSDGLVCFYDSVEEILLSSDFILDPITPNISVWPGARQHPLHDYIASLKKIMEVPVKVAYTAHGEVLYHVKERAEALIYHHEKRLEKIKELAANKTAYEIASDLFQHRELNPHQWRFAMAETIAHLNHLEKERKLEKHNIGKLIFYNQIQPSSSMI
ncbi:MBL fold metallo-hydrolase [Thalassobacillus sp. C254]|uniref:MBL fold metallo-hydrolase n=1 Tax=Thalassobacillus sp. C254 TaxID=1225341 RepID=UPI0006D2A6BA|nr:MBL fold metallo-hydrolase [Thalassobacillus sp. C254]